MRINTYQSEHEWPLSVLASQAQGHKIETWSSRNIFFHAAAMLLLYIT
jgi:hypothetical protein